MEDKKVIFSINLTIKDFFVYLLHNKIGGTQLKKLLLLIIISSKENTLARTSFVRDLKGSDSMHWGEGELLISKENGQVYATLDGEVAPGPDYKIYLTPKFVDDKDSFLAIKKDSQKVAEVNGFKNFRTMLPASTEVSDYAAIVIWCERFEKFITAGKLNIEG